MPTLMQSSLRFGKCVLFVSLCSLVGCANNRPSYGVDRMAEFVPDCRIAEQQIIWLNTLRPTYSEKVSAAFTSRMIPIATDGYRDRYYIANNQIDWWVDRNIEQVYQACQKS